MRSRVSLTKRKHPLAVDVKNLVILLCGVSSVALAEVGEMFERMEVLLAIRKEM